MDTCWRYIRHCLEHIFHPDKMNTFLILLVVLVSATVGLDSRPSRIFKERVRSQEVTSSTVHPDEDHEMEYHVEEKEHHEDFEPMTPKKSDNVMGSMDTMASLARVQRDQAETFRLWSSQFHVFKNSVMKFMSQTSDVLQKNEKKIKTLQRVVKKIANDIDE